MHTAPRPLGAVYISAHLKARLQVLAAEKNTTLNRLVENLVNAALKAEQPVK